MGTEHGGGGKTIDVLESLAFDYDLYCFEIDLFRLRTLDWFDTDVHLNYNLVYHPQNTGEWWDLHSSQDSDPMDPVNKSSSEIRDAFLSGCDIPNQDGLSGADIRFVLESLDANDRVALVDSGFLDAVNRIADSGAVRKVREGLKSNQLILSGIRWINPYQEFGECHRFMRKLKRYITPYSSLIYDYREEEIASNVDAVADSGDDVLLLVGFNHIEGVSSKLRDKGFDVESMDAVVDESV